MGKLKQIIVIQPLFIQDIPVEREVSTGHTCPVCHGNGKVSIKEKETRFKVCPFCKGSKKVKAVITTEWMPDKEEEK
jgi:DnaJ-class molecular chaperone